MKPRSQTWSNCDQNCVSGAYITEERKKRIILLKDCINNNYSLVYGNISTKDFIKGLARFTIDRPCDVISFGV